MAFLDPFSHKVKVKWRVKGDVLNGWRKTDYYKPIHCISIHIKMMQDTSEPETWSGKSPVTYWGWNCTNINRADPVSQNRITNLATHKSNCWSPWSYAGTTATRVQAVCTVSWGEQGFTVDTVLQFYGSTADAAGIRQNERASKCQEEGRQNTMQKSH